MTVAIVEVAPRDGFQAIGPFIATRDKIEFVRGIHAAGIRRIEIGSFVSPRAVPQLADTVDVLRETAHLDGLDAQVLVPTSARAFQALDHGARHLSFVLSASAAHNRSNVRRDPAESLVDYAAIVSAMPPSTAIRVNIATAFDCPFEGRVEPAVTLDLVDRVLETLPGVEISLCDTTGRATPDRVSALFHQARERFGLSADWNFHAHDTYGLGMACVYAAYEAGVRSFDAALSGLGGCPFAPGATGNVATEDVVWAFAEMGIGMPIDLDALTALADRAEAIPGACAGGRVRDALRAARRRREDAN